MERGASITKLGCEGRRCKTARIATILAERLDIDAERALNILYNSRTYALLDNPDSGLQLMSDSYILNDLLRELEA